MKQFFVFFIAVFIALSCNRVPDDYLVKTGKLPESIDSLKILLTKTIDDTVKMRILDKMVNVEKIDSIKKLYESQLETIIKINTKKDLKNNDLKLIQKYLGNVLHRKGVFYHKNNNFDSAIYYYNQAIKLRENIGDKQGMALTLNNIGIIFKDQGEYQQAISYFNKAIKIQEELNDKLNLASSLNNLGLVYDYQGDFNTALEYYQKSLKYKEEVGDKDGIANSLANIGNLYAFIGKFNLALEYYQKSLKIEEEIDNQQGIALSLISIGNVFLYQGNYDKAIDYYQKSISIYEQLNDYKGLAMTFNNLAIIYTDQVNYIRALECYQKSLRVYEKTQDKKKIASSLNNIATIYINQGYYERAMEYLNKSYKIYKEIKDIQGEAYTLGNIGKIYSYQKKYDESLKYYQKSLQIKEKLGDKQGLAMSYNSIGNAYLHQGKYLEALLNFKKSTSISKEIGEKHVYANSLSGLSNVYLHLNNITLSKQYADSAYKLSHFTKNIINIKEACLLLDTLYYIQGNYKLSRQYFAEYITMRDSIYSEEARKKGVQQYFQHEYEKKATADSVSHAKAIEIKNLEIEKQKTEVRKNKIIAGTSTGGGLVVLAFLVFVYRSLKITKRQKQIIEEQKKIVDTQNDELIRQNEEIKQQRDEIQSQRDTIQKQKEEIEYIHNELKSSISYARRIQEAMLPVDEIKQSISYPHFIFFEPKDVVSGDFYWYAETPFVHVFAVADCTGHGVPGGFMSMLGISLLNEIVRKKEVVHANLILNELRNEIIVSLKQRGVEGEQKDGMDISLLVVNKDINKLEWAGANNPLYIIVNNNDLTQLETSLTEYKIRNTNSNYCLIELEPDKMPIAIYPRMDSFANHTFTLPENSMVYLFSDGYADQFGGEKNKKYGYKRLRELFLGIADKDITTQQQIVENEFSLWKGNKEQMDDVTILAIQF